MITAFAPGRVNLIGEHTDYNDGLALPFAISAGVTVTAAPQPKPGLVTVEALDYRQSDAFDLSNIHAANGWRAFVRGAAAELQRAGHVLEPVALTISGDLPRGAGVSSSAALEVAVCLALLAAAGAPAPDRVTLARICSRIENEWAGAHTGLLDQLASLCAEPGNALRIDFRSLELRQVPLRLDRHRLVALHSGETHAHSASGYNARREACREACRLLNVSSLREATLSQVASLPEPLHRRARHVLTENARVEQAIAALDDGDMPALGALLDASHTSLRDDFEVSTKALDATADRLRAAGALGARLVGGGFGGSVLALLPPHVSPPDGALALTPGPGARLI